MKYATTFLLAFAALFLSACGGSAENTGAPPVAQVLPVESTPPIVVTPIEVVPLLVAPTPIVVPPPIVTPPPIVIAPVDPAPPIVTPPAIAPPTPPIVVPPVVVAPCIPASPSTSSIIIGFAGMPGNFPYSAFVLSINGIATTFYFKPADIKTVDSASSWTDQSVKFQSAILNAEPADSKTLANLGFSLVQIQDGNYLLTAPSGSTVTAGPWIFNDRVPGLSYVTIGFLPPNKFGPGNFDIQAFQLVVNGEITPFIIPNIDQAAINAATICGDQERAFAAGILNAYSNILPYPTIRGLGFVLIQDTDSTYRLIIPYAGTVAVGSGWIFTEVFTAPTGAEPVIRDGVMP